LRAALERRHGGRAGVRHYIRVLQLLAEHPLQRVQQAVVKELQQEPVQVDCLIAAVWRLGEAGGVAAVPAESVTTLCHSPMTPLCQYQVPQPDLGCFDKLLSQGDSEDA
jgi:hypothetical protein